MDQVCGTNGVPDEDFTRVSLYIYMKAFGGVFSSKRRVTFVHEVLPEEEPVQTVRWDERSDTFEWMAESRLVTSPEEERMAGFLRELMTDGVRKIEDVRARVVSGWDESVG